MLTVRKSRVERAQDAFAAEAARYQPVSPAKAVPAEPGAIGWQGAFQFFCLRSCDSATDAYTDVPGT